MPSKEWSEDTERHQWGVLHRVTFLLWVVFSAQWKLAVKKNSRPTKRLLRVKTSATMDHCQLSLDTANSPPASTAPGPGPVNLTVREEGTSFLYTTLERSVTFHTDPEIIYVYLKSHTVLTKLSNQTAIRRSHTLIDQLKCCFVYLIIIFHYRVTAIIENLWTKRNQKIIF